MHRFKMWLLLVTTVAALALITGVAGITQAQTGPAQQGTTQTTPTTPAAPARPPGCDRTYKASKYRKTIKRIYHQREIRHEQFNHLGYMRKCAKSPWHAKRMKKITAYQSYARRHRQAVIRRRECGSYRCNRRLGIYMAVRRYGRAAGRCIDFLVTHEGGWDGVHRYNGMDSGAYGLPQALPGYKMASAGRDWASSAKTQIRWMIGYVRKYGGMCGAMAFWQSHRPGWY